MLRVGEGRVHSIDKQDLHTKMAFLETYAQKAFEVRMLCPPSLHTRQHLLDSSYKHWTNREMANI